jgi:ethanolamine utilization microcompartment shell protein EutS
MAIDLRAYSFIDSLQPQLTGFLQTVASGFQPLEGQASLFVEVAPGITINQLTDVALKSTRVLPGMQIVERAFGLLEIHHEDQGEVLEAGAAILRSMGVSENSRLKPRVVSSEIITGIEPHQQMLLNRMRHGDMIAQGETLYVLETAPAAYAAIAANEAEKAADVRLLEVITFGAFGRLYLGGGEAEIEEAVKAAQRAIDSIDGRTESRR